MPAAVWTPREWEDYCHRLLVHHYGPAEYQKIPDEHVGDFGIEGYTEHGEAFQFFCPKGAGLSAQQRYERQRDKITADINKFIRNERDLADLFGDLQISRWILLVPRYDSARLAQHATKKSQDVRGVNLPYVTREFKIKITTSDDYPVAKKELVQVGTGKIAYPTPEVTEDDYEDWVAGERDSDLAQNLMRKTDKLQALDTPEKRSSFRLELVQHYLEGGHILGRLNDDYPETYEDVQGVLISRADSLSVTSQVTLDEGGAVIKEELRETERKLKSKIPSLTDPTATAIAMYAVADWILRCPLDFPEGHS